MEICLFRAPSPAIPPSDRVGIAAEVIALARAHEPERLIAATLARGTQRAALIALAAFAADLVRIPLTVTEPMLGEMRLQWWRDSLEAMTDGGRIGSPVADALGDAIAEFRLPVPMLVAMSEARAFDLYDDPMADQASLDGYLAKTEAIPFELALRILGVPPDHATALSIPAGRAFGLVRVLAWLPRTAAAGRCMLPQAQLAAFDLTSADLANGARPDDVARLIAALTRDVTAAIDALRPQLSCLTRRQRVALLPLAVLSPYLRAIDRRQWRGQAMVTELAPLLRVWRITVAHVAGRI